MAEVWIDSDAGFDDLLAIQMVANSPDHKIAGLSLVAGNSELEQVIDNAGRMAATFDWQFPLYSGAEKPLEQELETAANVLGPRGMNTKDKWFGNARVALQQSTAIDAMATWLLHLKQPAAILALGPLTNLAQLICDHPQLMNKISELVVMGGSTDRGNSTAVAEFNIYTDPEAAAQVFSSGISVKMIGINVCRQVEMIPDDILVLQNGKGENHALLADLATGYLSIRGVQCDKPMPLFDPTAAAALIKPELINWQQAHVAIELDGKLTRGMTVCEFRVPKHGVANTQVAIKANAGAIRKILFASLGIETA